MCEFSWHALAEINLYNQDKSRSVYCLCSRAFYRSKEDTFKKADSSDCSESDEEIVVDNEASGEYNLISQTLKSKNKQDVEHETVSCYCSASHTDNLSTDEHDSLRDSHESRSFYRGLQSSDSGTDLTEYVNHDVHADWQKFWSVNGEKLIWESWISKYSAYINPNYLQYAQHQVKTDIFDKSNKELLTLEIELSENLYPSGSKSDCERDYDRKDKILVRNLSGSDDKLNIEVSEGWNPLSPVSADGETDIEHLLSSRCGSHGSSLRTVDSMTNVTRMTISSLDLSQSSHSSESFSSVSSVQSSLSSTSSEENEEDYQHQWDVLWKKHYEEEYLRQYDLFVLFWKEHNIADLVYSERLTVTPNLTSPSHPSKQQKKNIHKVFQGKVDDSDVKCPIQVTSSVAISLGNLLNELKVSSADNSRMESEDGDTAALMAAMGLPTSFSSSKKKRNHEELEEDEEEGDIEYTDDNNDFESCRQRTKAAFALIGIQYNDTNKEPYAGQVNYKMKHIRLQNRHLQLQGKPVHIRFDEEGNPMSEQTATEEIGFHSAFLDSSDEKLSSPDVKVPQICFHSNFVEKKTELVMSPKKRRRRKRIAMSQEIKEKPKLIKFWNRRYNLFSKFDNGIKLDEESWYSVTPEEIAIETAKVCKCDVIIDGFCGAGGNAIQFALTCQRVIAIDIDPKKIELARHNAEIYGVTDRIEFIVGDFMQLAPHLKADVVFLSPPWGGMEYCLKPVYDLETMLQPAPIKNLLEITRNITNNIAIFLPKNSDARPLLEDINARVEIVQNFMKKKLVAVTVYYNDLVQKV